MKKVSEMTIKELQSVAQRIEKYEDAHKRYVEIAAKLKSVGEELTAMSKIIDPLQTIKARKSGKGSIKPIIEDLYAKLQAGTQITRKLIETTYTELNEGQIANILTKLGRCKGVDKARDGKQIRLFLR